MPRPVTTQQRDVDYGVKQEGGSVKLGVYAPLNVVAKQTSAMQLARALGVTTEPVMKALGMEMARQGEKDVKEAQAGAFLDDSDPKLRLEEITQRINDNPSRLGGLLSFGKSGFRARTKDEAAGKVYALKAWQQARLDAAGDIDAIDKTLPPQEYRDQVELVMRKHLGGIESDPLSAAVIAPRYADFLEKTMEGYTEQAVNRQRVDTVTSVQNDISEDLVAGGTGNFEEAVDTLTKQLGSREAARDIVVEQYLNSAVTMKDETVLDRLPAKITLDDGQEVDGPASSGRYAAKVEEARKAAKKARLEAVSSQRAIAAGDLQMSWRERFATGDWVSDEEFEMEYQRADRLLSDDEIDSYRAMQLQAQLKAEADLDLDEEVVTNPNMRLNEQVGTVRADGKEWTESDLMAVNDRNIENEAQARVEAGVDPEKALLSAAVAHTEKEGWAYRPWKSKLSSVPVSDYEEFKRSAELYKTIPAHLRHLYVPSEDQRDNFERYSQLTSAGGMEAKDALDLMQKESPESRKQNLARTSMDAQKRRKASENFVVDDGGWLGRSQKVGNLSNNSYALNWIDRRATSIRASGTSADDAYTRAEEEFAETHFVVPGPDGNSMAIPRVEGMSDKFPETMGWAVENIPGFVQSLGIDIDPKNVRFGMVGGSEGDPLIYLVDKRTGEAIQPGRIAFTPASLERARAETVRREQYLKATEAQEDAAQRGGDQRQYDEYGPDRPVAGVPLMEKGPRQRYRARRGGDPQAQSQAKTQGAPVKRKWPPDLNDSDAAFARAADAIPAEDLVQAGLDYAKEAHPELPPALIHAVAKQESSYGKSLLGPDNSRNRGRARGAFQIIKGTFDGINEKYFNGSLDWNNPEDVSKAGVALLADNWRRTGGNIPQVLSLYHSGRKVPPKGTDSAGKSTHAYIRDVIKLMRQFS